MIQLRFGEGLGDNKTSLISLAEASKIMLFYLMFFMLSTAQNNALKLASCLDLTAEYDLLLCEIVLPCESLRIYDTPHLLCALIQEVPKLHLKAPTGGLLQALALEICYVSAWGELAAIQISASSKAKVTICLGGTTVALKV